MRFKIIKVISLGQKILPKEGKPILKKLEFVIKPGKNCVNIFNNSLLQSVSAFQLV